MHFTRERSMGSELSEIIDFYNLTKGCVDVLNNLSMKKRIRKRAIVGQCDSYMEITYCSNINISVIYVSFVGNFQD